MIELYMPIFVISLLHFIPEYKMFMRIEKNFKEKCKNKVSMKTGINYKVYIIVTRKGV